MKLTFTPSQTVGTADRMIYGHFLEHFHRQVYGGIFDPSSRFADEDGFRSDVIEAMKRIKVPIIRWPGGCFVSAYDWRYGVTNPRVPTFNKAWRVEEPNTFGTDEFVALCRKVGCEPYICTNAGTGSAEEMSSWVEYCNLKNQGIFARQRIANGHEQPFNVKYWSIGNENWGEHEIGAKDSEEWGRLVLESAKMMQRVDPSIQLSAAALSDPEWNHNLLRRAGRWLDWISVHDYWLWGPDGVHMEGYDSMIKRAEAGIDSTINRVRGILSSYGLEKQVRIAYDEWNLRGWFHPNTMNNVHKDGHYSDEEVFPPRDRNDINETYTMTDAIFSALFLNRCLKNCDIVGMACFSPIVNTRGAIFTHKDGIVLRPTYHVFDLYANLLKDRVLSVWTEGAENLSEDCPVPKLDAVITYGDGMYAAAVVNKDTANPQTVDFRIIDGALSEYRVHTLNAPSMESYNDIGRDEVNIKVSPWQRFTGSVTVEPHSVNVIELK